MTTPLDLAKKACLTHNGVMDWRFCAEWMNLFSMEAVRRVDALQRQVDELQKRDFYTRPESKPGCYDGEAVE